MHRVSDAKSGLSLPPELQGGNALLPFLLLTKAQLRREASHQLTRCRGANQEPNLSPSQFAVAATGIVTKKLGGPWQIPERFPTAKL